jgi:hypothetical protein
MPIISSKASMSAQAYGLFGVTAAPYTLVGAYDALATVTVPSGGASSITFSAIPQTGYSHLQIRGITKSDRASNYDYNLMSFNGDTTAANYFQGHYLVGDGSSASAGTWGRTPAALVSQIAGANVSNTFAPFIHDILDYASVNKNKTIRSLYGEDYNGSGYVFLQSGLWISTSSINTISITNQYGNFVQNSQFTLYGIK